MSSTGADLRQWIKRALPGSVRRGVSDLLRRMGPPPMESIALHGYRVTASPDPAPRLSLVIPNVTTRQAFGGVSTCLDMFFWLARQTGADARILVDDFDGAAGDTVVAAACSRIGYDPARLEIVPRLSEVPTVDVRRCEAFLASNWWTFLNLQAILDDQARLFGDPRHPGLYVVQEYEPLFYPMSSTHLFARDALSDQRRSWHLINSSELQAFLGQMGHRSERSWLFEPALSEGLRPAFSLPPVDKVRRILVYGRPTIPRNCFSAVVEGVRRWAARHPEHGQWQVMSAGLPHPPIPLDGTRTITPVGKLDLSAYGALLRETAVGVSLMASAHPSYPPLEMAHFGLLTLTNSFHPKTLETSHENLRSVRSIAADHIADALARACADFEADPGRGWRGASLRPSFLVRDPLEQLASLVPALRDEFWPEAG